MRARARRPVVTAIAIGCVGASLLAATAASGAGIGPTASGSGDHKARNVILFIGDGMGVSHITAARERYYGAAGKLNMEKLPGLGTVQTYAVEQGSQKPSLVTDSASAGTAWASGVKTYNAAIGVDTNGKPVPTIMEQAKRRGMQTGNVSTAEITDATPAVMMSHVKRRTCQGPVASASTCDPGDVVIAEQVARNNVADVILGGGLARFEPDDQKAMEDDGYEVLGSFGDPSLPAGGQTAASQEVATKDDLAGVSAGSDTRVIGLFNRGNMTVETAKAANPSSDQAKEPALSDMTSKAIDLLASSRDGKRNGFFLQVEGALIDKRSHANDAAQTLGETKAFDDAIGVAMKYAARNPDTLVLVTADHECAGFNIIEKGTFTNAEATIPPANVDTGNTANNSTPSRSAATAKDPARSTGPVNGSGSGDPKNFAPATFRTADDPPSVKDGNPEASLWLSYLSGNHTGADVEIYSSGPGSDGFRHRIQNTDMNKLMKDALRAFH